MHPARNGLAVIWGRVLISGMGWRVLNLGSEPVPRLTQPGIRVE